MIADVPKRSVR